MTVLVLFLGFVLFLGVALIVIDQLSRRHLARARDLDSQLAAHQHLLREVQSEVRAELSAGDPAFQYVLDLITDSGLLRKPTTRKELPR